jgi:hypothetical protein
MQVSVYDEIVEMRRKETVEAEVNPYYMMSLQQSPELDVGPQPIIHIDTLRPMFKLDDEDDGGLASLCKEISGENNFQQRSSKETDSSGLGVPGKNNEKGNWGSPEFGAHYDNQLGPNDEPHDANDDCMSNNGMGKVTSLRTISAKVVETELDMDDTGRRKERREKRKEKKKLKKEKKKAKKEAKRRERGGETTSAHVIRINTAKELIADQELAVDIIGGNDVIAIDGNFSSVKNN